MARADFGGTASDFTFSTGAGGIIRVRPAVLTFWSAETGGTQYSDLIYQGSPTTQILTGTDGDVPTFQGPDGITKMWADPGSGSRTLILSVVGIVDIAEDAADRAEAFAQNDWGLEVDPDDPDALRFERDGRTDPVWGDVLDDDGVLLLDRVPSLPSDRVSGLSAALAVLADLGPGLEVGLDDQVRDLANAPGSAVRAAVEGLIKRREANRLFNVIDYGADPTGTTDSTTAFNGASVDALANGGTVFAPPGIYKTTSTVYIYTSIDARGATLNVTGGTIGLFHGADTTALFSTPSFLPRVVRVGTRTGTGVWLQNLNTCEVHIPWVQNFEVGLHCTGNATGLAYNTLHLGGFWLNRIQISMAPGASGWVNQNTFIGGRVQSDAYAGTEDTGAFDVRMVPGTGSNSGSSPNGNTFIGTSFEGNITAQYRLALEGRSNEFHNCRYEAVGGNNRVRFGSSAQYSHIRGGYGAETLTRTDITGQANNTVDP